MCVGVVRGRERIEELAQPTSVRELAGVADETGERLASVVRGRLSGRYADYGELVAERRLLAPVHHPDPLTSYCPAPGSTIPAAPWRVTPSMAVEVAQRTK